MPKDVLYGKTLRKSFARTPEIMDMPNLLEIQKSSYKWFLETGLKEVFRDTEAITDYSGNLELTFIDYTMKQEDAKYDIEECKARDATYAAPMKVRVRLRNKETDEIKEQEIFMGDFPIMTPGGTFVINGAERVIVSQIVRSPGVYFDKITDKAMQSTYASTVIPYHGAWLEYETDNADVFNVRIDKNRKLPITWFLRAMGKYDETMPATWLSCVEENYRNGIVNNKAIEMIFGGDERMVSTIEKDTCATRDEALVEIYKKLRPGDPPTVESAETLLNGLFFDRRRYDISNVGRYKFNKKLSLYPRIAGYELAETVVSPITGEVLFEAGHLLTRTDSKVIEDEGVISVLLNLSNTHTVSFPNTFPLSDDEAESACIYSEIILEVAREKYRNAVAADGTAEDRKLFNQYDENNIFVDSEGKIHLKGNCSVSDVLSEYQAFVFESGKLNEKILEVRLEIQKLSAIAAGKIEVPKVFADDAKEKIRVFGKEHKDNTDYRNFVKTQLQNAVKSISAEQGLIRVFSNGMVRMDRYVDFDPAELGIKGKVRGIILKNLVEQFEGEALKDAIRENIDILIPKHIIVDDMFSSVNYLNALAHGIGNPDDIDHLGNRRVRCVGELLQNQFRIGFSRMERVIRERMTLQDLDIVTPQSLINIRPVTAAIKEFFGSSPLSQFMDQTNPLAELTHKRRMSALGPGGLSRERASFDVRDVHYSHYGRLCPIETPEGPNIGLINYLASYARANEYGFLIAPFRKVEKGTCRVTDEIEYMTADMEDDFIVAQASEPVDENGCFINKRVTCRHRNDTVSVNREDVDYVDVSPKMMVSIATAMIPFLENDDANRALMGANMQRQAVPLMTTQAPIVATGIEHKCAVDSGVCVVAEGDGVVTAVDANSVTVRYDSGETTNYKLIKFARSNQGTCTNQRPIVSTGERVAAGDVLADGPSTSQGEIALGKNILVGYMNWEGYNYEDAVLLNERLVMEDVFTSIHIEEYECDARDTKLGPEEITRDIPGVGDDALKYLDERGIIMVGAEVTAGDILVGKVTPKGETDLTAEERLLRAIFGEKAREVRDTSLKVPHGESGIIVDVKVFTRENGDEMNPGVNEVVRVYIAQKRKISVGDKMAGRHGNKGVVSRILPREDMPYLPDGRPLDIVLNPLGVPSRMNIGQILEVHLGYAAQALGWKVATPVFNGANETTIRDTLRQAGLREDGKSTMYDGRTGEKFDNDVTVGWVYFLKLHHLVDDKIHARSTGPYSLVTQQPLGGKAQFGGQRFGEMEVWALEAYGAAYTLQEILTVKSDDVTGRVKTYEAIVKGNNIPQPGVPESFKVLVKELQSLCLDVRVLDAEGSEIELKEDDEDEFIPDMKDEFYAADDSELEAEGFSIENAPEDEYDAGAFETDYSDNEEDM